MAPFTAHTLKRQARKEAWYSDSWNPFKKNLRRNTRASATENDVENVEASIHQEPLSAIQIAPPYESQRLGKESEKGRADLGDGEATSNSDSPAEDKKDEPHIEQTANEKTDSLGSNGGTRNRFPSVVATANGEDAPIDEEEEEKPKKRSWYKGKVLKHKPFTLRNQLEATLFNSWVNILLLAAPAGIACNYAKVNGTIVFVVNFIAIIPLAALLSFATEEIALHVGESLGGLLNASFGNAVEIIVAVIALAKDEVVVVQTSLIGSILSNLLLVMGMCFFFGGLRRPEQFFNQTVAQTAASLLALSIGSIIIPTCFDLFSKDSTAPLATIAAISRGTSVILLLVYGAYLFFQLYTHHIMFNTESQKVAMKPHKNEIPKGAVFKGLAKVGGVGAGAGRPRLPDRPPNDELIKTDAYVTEDEEPEEPQLHIIVAWATLAGATAVIGLCAEFMVDGISSITEGGKISVEFVGLIMLPIVGNAAEHATAVTVAVKDKMDLAIGVAVGSSMQISLLVIPLLVVIGWIMDKDAMTLSFDGFQVAVLFVSVLLVNYLIGDGKSHWLEGMLLICLYFIISVCAWYYPQAVPAA